MAGQYLERRKVYDAIQRLIHAWIGADVVALVLLGWFGKFMDPGASRLALIKAHILLGNGLVVGLVARMVWGVVGPEHARLSALVHREMWVKAFREWRLKASYDFGHDAFASVIYLMLYGVLAASAISGIALAGIRYDLGPLALALFDDFTWHQLALWVHEAVLYAATGFMVIHVGAMIVHEEKRGYPIVQAMVTGYQYRRHCAEEKDND